MDITEKLGKMGIPGFRSGNKWKMAIAIFGYFWIFIILLAMISPSPDTTTQKVSPEEPIQTVKPTVMHTTVNRGYETIIGLVSNIKEDTSGNDVIMRVQIKDKELVLEYFKEEANNNDIESTKKNLNRFIASEIKESYEEQKEIEINYIDQNKITTVSIKSNSLKPQIKILSEPTNADLYIDGVYKGKTPLTIELENGTYSLDLKLEGYNSVNTTIDVPNVVRQLIYLYPEDNIPTSTSSSGQSTTVQTTGRPTISPITLSGKGQKASDKFDLPQGLVRFDMTHDGKSNFAIWLLDDQGNKKELLVNDIGKFQGSKAVRIEESGDYLLDVSADGNWNIKIESVTVMSSIPSTLSGKGQKATDLFYLSQGLVKFDMSHDGTSNFAIWLLDDQGNKKELLVNEIGKFQGSKAVRIEESGNYLLDINADGNWNTDIS